MADVTIGELPSLNTMEADTLIPVEHDGEAKSMAGSGMQSYVYGLVQDDVETISEIIAVGPKGEDGADGADGVSPTLSSSKSGKTTTVYYTDADHPTSTVLATLQDGADGSGIGDMLKSVYDPNERYTDIFAYCDAHGLRSATVIVAASNSKNANSADFICDGTADHLTIQAAIDSLPNAGGRVLLMEGAYYLDCTDITPDASGNYTLIAVSKNNVSICGQGTGSYLFLNDVSSTVGNSYVNILSVAGHRFWATDIRISCDNTSIKTNGIVLGSKLGIVLDRVVLWNCGNAGIVSSGNDTLIVNCSTSSCGDGIVLADNYAQVKNYIGDTDYTGISIQGGTHIISDCIIHNCYTAGIQGSGGKRCLISNIYMYDNGNGIDLDSAEDFLITGNVIFPNPSSQSWGSSEYPLRCTNCTRPHIINNYVYGKAVSVSNTTGAVLSYSGSDWNPTA